MSKASFTGLIRTGLRSARVLSALAVAVALLAIVAAVFGHEFVIWLFPVAIVIVAYGLRSAAKELSENGDDRHAGG